MTLPDDDIDPLGVDLLFWRAVDDLAEPEVSSHDLLLERLSRLRTMERAERGAVDSGALLREALEIGRTLAELGPGYGELALTALRFAVDTDPTSAEAHRELAEVLVEMDRAADAVAQIELALESMPSDIPTLLTAAGAFAAAGRESDASRLEPRIRAVLPGAGLDAGALDEIDAFFAHIRRSLAGG